MDFELNEDQLAYSDMAKAFAENELAPNAAHWDEQQHFPVEVLKRAGEMGLCGLYTPEEGGGLGLSRLDSSIIFEQMAAGCTATTAYLTIHNMVSWMLSTFATDSCKAQWSEALSSGDKLGSYCLTEPNAGSDAASLKTNARKQGDKYIINGGKVFISGAGETDLLLVMARTSGKGAKGISAFAVAADSAGISYGRKEKKMGWNCQPTRSITFENVEIDADCLLGTEGDGFKIAMQGLDGGRVNIATCSVGTAQAALTYALRYLHERQQFGRELASFQALQFKVANMNTELVAARQMVRLAASKLDNKHPDRSTYCAMAKRFATDVCFNICDEALQILGGNGYMQEYPLERYLRDSRVHRILEGTNEIMNVIIARRILIEETNQIL
ncbi:MAG: acyl-CoA dehydrogenase family protein [Pseudomonadales bacterium]|nr:acyl-CoA dehydrogenase family protein [Pseudomonadales bacterium]NRA16587.1 acyl-CoA dehydrogenase family protein [Oceanospirillaceae bacterium]